MRKVIVNQLKMLLLIVVSIWCIIFCCSCGGVETRLWVKMQAIYTERQLEFLFINKQAAMHELFPYEGLLFYTKVSYDTLCEIVQKHVAEENGIMWETDSDSFGVVFNNTDQTKDYFFFANAGKEDEYNVFYASSMSMSLSFEEMRGVYMLLFPQHMIKNPLYEDWCTVSNAKFQLKEDVSQDDIFTFYNECGWFEVEQNSNCITLTGYRLGHIPMSKKVDSSIVNEFKIPFPLKIEILNENNSRFITIRSMKNEI